ncbi:hypothetical protein INR49_007883 [Caranx melampygus]|nr:hypothetical protein INR49_007883 [Caranx melampygus]
MSADQEHVCDLQFSFAEERDFQQVLNICSSDDFDGLDYMETTFHRWLQEPGRLIFLARMKDRVVSTHADFSCARAGGAGVRAAGGRGQTVVFQGLRVAPDLRGRGIAGALQRHVIAHVRHHYPEVSALRLSRAGGPSAQTPAKYRAAILSLCCEASDLGPFVSELRSRLPSQTGPSSHGPVSLTQQQAETLILTDHVISNLLPGKTIINDWEPLKPVKANMEVLRRRGLTWIVDCDHEPSAISLCTTPYAVPYRHDALHFNINIFGCSLSSVCAVFVAQLEALLPSVQVKIQLTLQCSFLNWIKGPD